MGSFLVKRSVKSEKKGLQPIFLLTSVERICYYPASYLLSGGLMVIVRLLQSIITLSGLRRGWQIAVYASVGIVLGVGLFVARVSNAVSYLSDAPETCINCHVMTDAYASWQRGSHGRVAVCTDCHVPHQNFISKYAFKSMDGLRHSAVFTLRAEPQVLELSRGAKPVVQENCLNCHSDQFAMVCLASVTERSCWDCHHTIHGEVRSQSASPEVLRPPLPRACAPCHVEYYFKETPKNYLKFPWGKGTTVEGMIDYYDAIGFSDYTHAISKTPILKAQHPDFEMYSTGIHAYRGVSCADCHMPYKAEGGQKYTDHHVQSPLLNIANSCAVCHRWSEDEIRRRVETIQDKTQKAKADTEDALVKAHFDIAAAMEAGAGDEELAEARRLLRHAQFRWDYVSANNGMGFHSPQETMRILGDSVNQAQQSRLLAARILAKHGAATEVGYPDISTREKAWDLAERYAGEGQ